MKTVSLRTVRLIVAVLLVASLNHGRNAPAAQGQPNQAGSTITVSTTADDIQNNNNCTLREAVQAANLDQGVDNCPAGSGDDVIHVPAGTYTLTIPGMIENDNQTGDIDIRSSLTIQGAGQATTIIQVDQSKVVDRIFHVVHSDVLVRINAVTLRNGNLTREGEPDGEVEEPLGGAVYNAGVLKVTNSALVANVADGIGSGRGGALYNNGSLEVTGSFFTKNDAGYGGGSIHNDHILTVHNTRFEDNDGYGSGGIETSSTSQTTITDSQFVANQIGLAGGGALTLGGQTTIQNTLFDNNQGDDGTISNHNRLTIKNSLFINNWGSNSVIINSSKGGLTIDGTTFENNKGFYSGAIYGSASAGIMIRNSMFKNNTGDMMGGAITLTEGSIEIHNTTLQGNHGKQGGALFIDEDVQVYATLSTISNNTADEEGGGIYSQGQFNFQNTTISGNQAAQGGGIYLENGLESIFYDTTLTANNPSAVVVRDGNLGFVRTILAGNLPAGAPDCDTQDASEVDSRGHNLVGNGDGCHWTPEEGDLVGSAQQPLDPLLGPLSDNGGSTFTHALLPGSQAVDAAGAANCSPTDQRGQPRPSGPACDIGAFEVQSAASLQFHYYLPLIKHN